MAHNYLDLWLWTLFGSTGLFTIRYFNLKETDRTFYTFIVLFVGVFISAGVLNLFVPLALIANVYQGVAGVFYLGCLIFSYRLLIRGEEKAKLYCMGWTFMMTGAIFYMLVYNGMLPYNLITRNVSYVGAGIEILIFSIALGQRISKLKEEQVKLNRALEKSNATLRTANESLDSFNYHVSHDLKTVLNNSIGLSKMAKKYNNKKDENRVDEVLNKLLEVSENGRETVQSFLSLAKIDNLLKDQQGVETLIIADELNALIDNHQLRDQINIHVDRNELTKIRMHRKAFESIFLNFLTNSVKYRSANFPEAHIQFIDQVSKIIIVYKDNGQGIDLNRFGNNLFKTFHKSYR